MKWATAASAIPFVPDTATCRRATPGTALDYFAVSTNLASIKNCLARAGCTDLEQVPDLPKELPLAAPPGRSRYPHELDTQLSADVTDTQGLAACTDSLMCGVARELTN
eukprot:7032902-Pyramimonas_sp.AAC.1